MFERLEDRRVLATFHVTNAADDGEGSLRAAVYSANVTAGADTIDFRAGLGQITLTTGQLTLSDTIGPTTITGGDSGVTIARSAAVGNLEDPKRGCAHGRAPGDRHS